jgi:hypothetical protein
LQIFKRCVQAGYATKTPPLPSGPLGGGSREESPQGLFEAFAQAAAGADLILMDTQLPVLEGALIGITA